MIESSSMEFWWKNSNFNSWIVDRKWISIKVVVGFFWIAALTRGKFTVKKTSFEFSSSVFCWIFSFIRQKSGNWKKNCRLYHIFIAHILILMWNNFLKIQQIVLDSCICECCHVKFLEGAISCKKRLSQGISFAENC